MRICVWGTAGSGKSTYACELFSILKKRGFAVEFTPEYIKTWCYQGRKPESWDQLYVFGKQLHREDVILRRSDHIVTDSPLLMNTAYSEYYGFEGTAEIRSLAIKFEQKYPSTNLFLHRTHRYDQKARYQSEGEAAEAEKVIYRVMRENLPEETIFEVRGNLEEATDWVIARVPRRAEEDT